MRSVVLALAIGIAAASCLPQHQKMTEAGYSMAPVTTDPSVATEIRIQGSVYYRLTGHNLRQAIVGNSMFYDLSGPGFIMTTGDGRHFNSDGCGYVKNRHHAQPASGTYSVKDDRVCTRDEDAEESSCFALFRSDEGRLLQQRLTPSSGPSRVVVKPNTTHDGFHSCPLIETSQ